MSRVAGISRWLEPIKVRAAAVHWREDPAGVFQPAPLAEATHAFDEVAPGEFVMTPIAAAATPARTRRIGTASYLMTGST
jgi:hypothetical protein